MPVQKCTGRRRRSKESTHWHFEVNLARGEHEDGKRRMKHTHCHIPLEKFRGWHWEPHLILHVHGVVRTIPACIYIAKKRGFANMISQRFIR